MAMRMIKLNVMKLNFIAYLKHTLSATLRLRLMDAGCQVTSGVPW